MIKAIGYYLSLPLLYFVAILPFWLLYLMSDGLYMLLYYVIGYRKQVVQRNLEKSFPEKTVAQRKAIEKAFFKHLCDITLESFKLLIINKKTLTKRCQLSENAKRLFAKYYEENIPIIAVMGHMGNWEWASAAFSAIGPQQLYGIYHPLRNERFDRFFYNMRTRFGAIFISMRELPRHLSTIKKSNSVLCFIADQSPAPEFAYWINFLNQDTAVYTGTEKIALRFNSPVVFISVNKLKRGYYEIDAELITDTPQSFKEGELTLLHTQLLEHKIKQSPYTWLWSHKRWKHQRPLKTH